MHKIPTQAAALCDICLDLTKFSCSVLLLSRSYLESHSRGRGFENEAQFRAMFEAAVVGQTQASATTGLFTRVNQRFCEVTGYSEAELLQMRPRDLMHPAD